MSADWSSYPDAHAAAKAAAHHISKLLEATLARQDRATFAISGGSTPKLLFQELVKLSLPWRKIHLFWVDERPVPPTDPQSNYKLAEENLIAPAHIPRGNVHRIQAELAPPELAAETYVAEIRQFFSLDSGQLPEFDVVQQGMGPDAHTASLFPGDPLIEDRERIAGAVFVEKIPQWRITLLPGALLAARHTVFLVSGADKAPSVRAVFKDEYNPLRLPAQIVATNGRNVSWFLDDAASGLIREL